MYKTFYFVGSVSCCDCVQYETLSVVDSLHHMFLLCSPLVSSS